MTQWQFNSLIALFNTDVELLDEYTGKSKKVKWRCKRCGGEFESFPRKLLEGRLHSKSYHKCRWGNCLVKDKSKTAHIVQEIYKNTKDKFLLLSLYRDDTTPINVQCLLCGGVSKLLPGELRKKKVCCIFCKSKQYKKKESKKDKTESTIATDNFKTLIRRKCEHMSWCIRTGEYLCGEHQRGDCLMFTKPYYSAIECDELIKINNPSMTILSNYIDRKTEINCRCNRCGYEFTALPNDLLNGVHCKKCSSSYGEQSIMNYLDSINIKYIREKTFPNCRYYRLLRFDFYLPDYNAIIEYDGEQHYRPIEFTPRDHSYSIEQFESLKKRDSIKNAYCKQYKIPILRIRYDEDIKKSLEKFLDELGSRNSK